MQLAKQNFFRNLSIVIVLSCTAGASLSYAGPREQAKRIHDRLVGVPPSGAVIDSMAAKISAGDGQHREQWHRILKLVGVGQHRNNLTGEHAYSDRQRYDSERAYSDDFFRHFYTVVLRVFVNARQRWQYR